MRDFDFTPSIERHGCYGAEDYLKAAADMIDGSVSDGTMQLGIVGMNYNLRDIFGDVLLDYMMACYPDAVSLKVDCTNIDYRSPKELFESMDELLEARRAGKFPILFIKHIEFLGADAVRRVVHGSSGGVYLMYTVPHMFSCGPSIRLVDLTDEEADAALSQIFSEKLRRTPDADWPNSLLAIKQLSDYHGYNKMQTAANTIPFWRDIIRSRDRSTYLEHVNNYLIDKRVCSTSFLFVLPYLFRLKSFDRGFVSTFAPESTYALDIFRHLGLVDCSETSWYTSDMIGLVIEGYIETDATEKTRSGYIGMLPTLIRRIQDGVSRTDMDARVFASYRSDILRVLGSALTFDGVSPEVFDMVKDIILRMTDRGLMICGYRDMSSMMGLLSAFAGYVERRWLLLKRPPEEDDRLIIWFMANEIERVCGSIPELECVKQKDVFDDNVCDGYDFSTNPNGKAGIDSWNRHLAPVDESGAVGKRIGPEEMVAVLFGSDTDDPLTYYTAEETFSRISYLQFSRFSSSEGSVQVTDELDRCRRFIEGDACNLPESVRYDLRTEYLVRSTLEYIMDYDFQPAGICLRELEGRYADSPVPLKAGILCCKARLDMQTGHYDEALLLYRDAISQFRSADMERHRMLASAWMLKTYELSGDFSHRDILMSIDKYLRKNESLYPVTASEICHVLKKIG